jgi:hypothetical protein
MSTTYSWWEKSKDDLDSGHTNVLSNKDKIARGAHLFLQQLNSLNVNPRCVVCEHMHW